MYENRLNILNVFMTSNVTRHKQAAMFCFLHFQ